MYGDEEQSTQVSGKNIDKNDPNTGIFTRIVGGAAAMEGEIRSVVSKIEEFYIKSSKKRKIGKIGKIGKFGKFGKIGKIGKKRLGRERNRKIKTKKLISSEKNEKVRFLIEEICFDH